MVWSLAVNYGVRVILSTEVMFQIEGSGIKDMLLKGNWIDG